MRDSHHRANSRTTGRLGTMLSVTLKLTLSVTFSATLSLTFAFATATTLLYSATALADTSHMLQKLAGTWNSDGPAFSKPGSASLAITPALEGKFYRLSYHVKSTGEESKAFEFSGEAMYREGNTGKFTGSWADSAGELLPITAISDASSLTSTWGTPGTKLGRTTYTLTDDHTLLVTDESFEADNWSTFNTMTFTRKLEASSSSSVVSGIGGIFFRGSNPGELTSWYKSHFDISGPPSSLEETPWQQDAGYTIFSPFPQDSDYFGNPDKQWMLNFRVRDLDTLVSKLRENGIEVSETTELPYGRFARLVDPDGNPIELWEPVD